MTKPLPVIVNASGGTAARMGKTLGDALRAAFEAAEQSIELDLVEAKDMARAIERHAGARVIAVGGGDGTLGGAAGLLADTRTSLAILPLGTRNHLALQLGIPGDLTQAAAVAAHGHHRQIDLGAAGERMFVNNASLGIYTRLVRERDKRWGPKWFKTVPAAVATVRHWRAQHFDLKIDRKHCSVETPLLFIGNNRYSLEAGHVGERETMIGGVLSLYAIAAKRPLGLAAFAARALVGRADAKVDFEELAEAKRVVIGGKGSIEVGLDGEVVQLALPLILRILPGALSVVVPEPVRARPRGRRKQ